MPSVRSDRKSAQAIFVNRLGGRQGNEGKGRIRKLLPYREVSLGNRQPAERKQVTSGLGHAADLGPGNLVNCVIDHIINAFGRFSRRVVLRDESAMIPLECGFGKEKEGRSPLFP